MPRTLVEVRRTCANGFTPGGAEGRGDHARGRERVSGWRAAAVAGAGFVLLWALVSLGWPFGLDQGIFAWVGDTVLRGGWPYRDAWEIKGPATHFLYALAQALFGRNVWGLRVLDLALLAVSAAAAYGWTARSVAACAGSGPARLAGGVAAFAWVLLYASGGHWHAAQPDGWAAMAWLGAAWLVVRPAPRPAHWLAAGALCGFAGLLKPVFAPFLVLLWLDRFWRDDARTALRVLPAALGGLLAVLAAVVVAFAWAGALADLVEVQLVFNPSLHPTAYRDLGPGAVLLTLLRWFSQPWAGAAFALGLLGAGVAWRTARADALLLLGWLVGGLLLVVGQNQYFSYHFWPLLAGCALGAGLAAGAAARTGAPAVRAGLAAAVVLALLLAAWQPARQIRRAAAVWADGSPDAARHYRDSFGMGSYGFGAMERIAAHIRAHTQPGEPILVWGFESGLYFLADRPASSRFGFLYPLVRGGGSELEARYLAEFAAGLQTNPPVYAVVFAQSYDEAALPEANRRVLESLWQLLDRCYVRDETLTGERVRAWTLRADGPAGCPVRRPLASG